MYCKMKQTMSFTFRSCVIFMSGFMIGNILFLILRNPKEDEGYKNSSHFLLRVSQKTMYEKWFEAQNLVRTPALPDEMSFMNNDTLKELSEASLLYKNVSVFCVVFVKKLSNAYAIANSWGRKCNNIRFYGQFGDKYLNITRIQLKSSWQYLCDTIRHVWSLGEEHLQWVLFVFDDLYVIPENLRYLVVTKDHRERHYLGHISVFWNQVYNAAGAGYVLSHGSVQALINRFNTSRACEVSGKFMKNEDYYLGKYLSEMGVSVTDCRDEDGRGRFHMFTPSQLMAPGNAEVLTKYSKKSLHTVVQGIRCCSPTSVTFQGSGEDLIFFYSYLMYRVKVFDSGHRGNNKSSTIYTQSDQVWQRFVRDELGDIDMKQVSPDMYYKLWKMKVDSPEQFNKNLRDQALGLSLNLTIVS